MRALVADAELPPKIGIHSAPRGRVRSRDAGVPARRGGRRLGRPDGHEVGHRRPRQQRARPAGHQCDRRPQRPRDRAADRDPRRPADHRRADRRGERCRDPALRRRTGGRGRPAGAGRDHRGGHPGARPPRGPRPRRCPASSWPCTTVTRTAPRRWRRGRPGRPAIGRATVAASAREAVGDADVVLTLATFTTPDRRQMMTLDWLAPEALVVAVDYDTMCAAEVADDAALFLVDDRGQFLANREAGSFDGYPDPGATIGEALIAGTPRPGGRVVVSHLGVGLADVVFADAILAVARLPTGVSSCLAEALSRARSARGSGPAIARRDGRVDGPSGCHTRRRSGDRMARARVPSAAGGGSATCSPRCSVVCSGSSSSLALVVVVAVGGLLTLVTVRGLPQTTGSLQLAGLHAPASILRDANGIAQIVGRRRPRPVHGPGLRARPGAVLADGGLASRGGRHALRALRGDHGRRRTRSSGRSAWRQAAERDLDAVSPTTAQGRPAGLRRRRQRLARRPPGKPRPAVRRRSASRPGSAAAWAATTRHPGRRSTR